MRCNDTLAGPNFVKHDFTCYAVLNTETRKWPVEALVENLPGNSGVYANSGVYGDPTATSTVHGLQYEVKILVE
jgi:hypothetical protein